VKKAVEVRVRVYVQGTPSARLTSPGSVRVCGGDSLRLGAGDLKGYTLRIRELEVDDDPSDR
jgi:hypothetical protein